MCDTDGETGRLGGPVGQAGGEVVDAAGHGFRVVAWDVSEPQPPADAVRLVEASAKNGTTAASSMVMPGTCSAKASALLTMSTRSPAR